MKKYRKYTALILLFFVLLLSGCLPKAPIKDNVEVVIGDSARYSQSELSAAADSVIEGFELNNCELLLVKYDEEFSIREEAIKPGYLLNSSEKDIICFTVNFYADSKARDGLDRDYLYTDFKYWAEREDKNSPWLASLGGYA